MAMEGSSNSAEGSTCPPSRKNVTEQIQERMKLLGKHRTIYPAKCAELLHQSLKLQVQAVDSAVVNVKLPSSLEHLERQKAIAESSTVVPPLGLDLGITPCNAPRVEETATFDRQLKDLTGSMQQLQTVLLQVKSVEKSAVYHKLCSN